MILKRHNHVRQPFHQTKRLGRTWRLPCAGVSDVYSGAFTRRLHAAPFFQAKPAKRDLIRRPPIWGASALPPPLIEHETIDFLGYLWINFTVFWKENSIIYEKIMILNT